MTLEEWDDRMQMAGKFQKLADECDGYAKELTAQLLEACGIFWVDRGPDTTRRRGSPSKRNWLRRRRYDQQTTTPLHA